MKSSQMTDAFLADEIDRIIGSANIRIEQQRIYLEQSAGNPQQVRSAGAVLDRMLGVLDNLKRYGRNIPRSQ